MPAYKLNLCVNNTFAGKVGQNLMPEKMGVNTLGNPGLPGIIFHYFSDPAGSEFVHPI
jgi:hypothetical protein